MDRFIIVDNTFIYSMFKRDTRSLNLTDVDEFEIYYQAIEHISNELYYKLDAGKWGLFQKTTPMEHISLVTNSFPEPERLIDKRFADKKFISVFRSLVLSLVSSFTSIGLFCPMRGLEYTLRTLTETKIILTYTPDVDFYSSPEIVDI